MAPCARFVAFSPCARKITEMKVRWGLPDGEMPDGGIDAVRADIAMRTARAVDEALRASTEINVSFDWLERTTFNAQVAPTLRNVNLVRVNSGTVARLYSTFLALLSDPRFLPHLPLPDPDPEVVAYANKLARAHLFGLDPDGIVKAAERTGCFDLVAPTDELRARTAIGLANIALDFILWHELAHVARGHLRLLPTGRLRMFHAFGDSTPRDRQLLRACEHDADSCATLACISTVLGTGAGFAFHNMPDVFDSDERTQSYVVIALCVLFTLCRTARPMVARREVAHPAPDLRYWNSFLKMGRYLHTRGPDELETFRLCASGGLMHVRALPEQLGCNPDTTRWLSDLESGYSCVKNEIEVLDAAVRALEPQLTPVHIQALVNQAFPTTD